MQEQVATLVGVRTLGVDLGSKRIGLAISDEAGEFAFPAGILESRGHKRDIAALCKLIAEKEIGRAVIGLPIHMDGRRGPEAEKATQFANALQEAGAIPVDTLDERWTSKEAERVFQPAPQKQRSKKRKVPRLTPEQRKRGVIDEMSASIILRTYLEQRRRSSAAEDLEACKGA